MIARIISHYRILEKIGEGGMGVVYKAEDIKLGRRVVLKFLAPYLTRDQQAIERLINEAKTASALDHPNICTIYEIDEIPVSQNIPERMSGQLFIAMAYYDGETLQQKVASGQLPVASIIDIATQIANGLARAHEAGIIHRDIKPANIIITKRREAKIVDFGLAKLSGQKHLTKTSSTMGTVAYMSPELAQGLPVDHRTDIWSLGVLIYEMLTGQLPFKGEYDQAVLYAIVNVDYAPITNLRPDMPSNIAQVIDKALAKKPEERYLQANEILADLKSRHQGTETGIPKRRPTIRLRQKRFWQLGSMVAFLVLLLGIGLYFRTGVATKEESVSRDKFRIAVLPFANFNPDSQDEYFVDGITEELISKLSKISGLGVIARTSVMRYKDSNKSITEIGNELKVGKVLEGSVRKMGNKLRITVQLVEVQTQEPVWSNDYEREFQDVFAIQSDIARQVAEALKVRLLAREQQQIDKRGAENLEAYTLYLKGRYYWNKRTKEGFYKGIECFAQAIAKNPNYAQAHSGLADCYRLLGWFSYLPVGEAYPKAVVAAKKALEIDSSLAEAHASLAGPLYQYDYQWLEAEQEYKQAIELDPNYATAHHWYALYLAMMPERQKEAIMHMKRAQELDPLSLIINAAVGRVFYLARKSDQAIEQCQRTLEMDQNFWVAHFILGAAYVQKGEYEAAIAESQQAVITSSSAPQAVSTLAISHALSGRANEATKIVTECIERSKQEYFPPYWIAAIYASLGEEDQAFLWLDKGYAERSHWLTHLNVEPIFDPLRSDPRYVELCRKVGLQ